jgi:hypothetical protein
LCKGDTITYISGHSIKNGTIYDDDYNIDICVPAYITLHVQAEDEIIIMLNRKGTDKMIHTKGVSLLKQNFPITTSKYFYHTPEDYRILDGLIIVPLTVDIYTRCYANFYNVPIHFLGEKQQYAIVDCLDKDLAEKHNFPCSEIVSDKKKCSFYLVRKINGTPIHKLTDIDSVDYSDSLTIDICECGKKRWKERSL